MEFPLKFFPQSIILPGSAVILFTLSLPIFTAIFHKCVGCPSIPVKRGVWAHRTEEGFSLLPWSRAAVGHELTGGFWLSLTMWGPWARKAGTLQLHPSWLELPFLAAHLLCRGLGFPNCFFLIQASAIPSGGPTLPRGAPLASSA